MKVKTSIKKRSEDCKIVRRVQIEYGKNSRC